MDKLTRTWIWPKTRSKHFKIHLLFQVKVVILGQDPYHGPNQAHGLCFSVKRPVSPPPRLKTFSLFLITLHSSCMFSNQLVMYLLHSSSFSSPVWRTCTKNWSQMSKAFSTQATEIWLDGPNKVWIFTQLEKCWSLMYLPSHTWLCSSGVLLLNAVLTVRAHQANSHKDKGWETFTDAVVQWLSKNLEGLVFMLWGSYAQKKGASINRVSRCCFNINLFKLKTSSCPCF